MIISYKLSFVRFHLSIKITDTTKCFKYILFNTIQGAKYKSESILILVDINHQHGMWLWFSVLRFCHLKQNIKIRGLVTLMDWNGIHYTNAAKIKYKKQIIL